MTSPDESKQRPQRRTDDDQGEIVNLSSTDFSTHCGIGNFHPNVLQSMARVQVFVCFFGINGLLTQTLGVYVNSQVSTLERQFGFSSAQTGLLMSCNDIGYLSGVIIAGYIARKVHIPRGLGLSTILYGFSGVMCALPFFLEDSSVYDIRDSSPSTGANFTAAVKRGSNLPLCDLSLNASALSGSAGCSDDINDTDRQALWIKKMSFSLIAIGMVLQGLGKCPRYPFVTLYVDDAVDKRKTGFYMGIITMTGIFGPALAYVFGGLFSKTYVTLKSVPITPRDPRWIGAWWLGFLMFGAISIVVGVPLACFPRKLRNNKRKDEVDMATKTPSNSVAKKTATNMVLHQLKGFFSSVIRVFKNPVHSVLLFSSCVNLLGVAGVLSFMPKYLASQYSIPVWQGNIILAGSNIAAVSLGSFVGGLMTRKLKMTPLLTCKLLILFYIINNLAIVSGFFLGCEQPKLVGSTGSSDVAAPFYTPLNNTCGTGCQCQDEAYFPICGDDGRSFFSPCHAGCASSSGRDFNNCTCIPSGHATAGLCDQGCSRNLYIYAALTFVGKLVTAFKIIPSFIAKIRCVEERDRGVSSALSGFTYSLLAWMPGPVIFGALIDDSCLLWKYTCGERQSCKLYDIPRFRNTIHAFSAVTGMLGCLIICMLYIYFRVKGQNVWREEEQKAVTEKIINDGSKVESSPDKK